MSRPRVVAQLRERLDRFGAIKVYGAAGIGKTTAVMQLAESLDVPSAWLTLAEWHREPGRLLEDVAAALGSTVPGLRRGSRVSAAGQPDLVLAASHLGSHSGFGSRVLLVLDDCHQLLDAPDARAVLAALVRDRHRSLSIVLIGRELVPLPGLGVSAHHPDAYVGPEVLNADLDETRLILGAHGSSVDPVEALAATGGWVAALVFESWRSTGDDLGGRTPLDIYFAADVRPSLDRPTYDLLVETSVFETVDAGRAAALGHPEAAAALRELRDRGFPATWSEDGSVMRVHSRVRELLLAELERRPNRCLEATLAGAAAAYEAEGLGERAIDAYLRAGDDREVRRLLPEVIVEVVERGDVGLAQRLLAIAEADEEHDPRVLLARLMLTSSRQSGGRDVESLLDELGAERLTALAQEEPRLGPYICIAWVGERSDAARHIVERMSPGREADTARLILSLSEDDPEAPVPGLADDTLDPLVARCLWGRGKLFELQAYLDDDLRRSSGIPDLLDPRDAALDETGGAALARFSLAVDRRDLAAAREAIDAVAESLSPVWVELCEAEAAVRLARDPSWAADAIDRLRASPAWQMAFYREVAGAWEGAALLIADRHEAAVDVLREAVASMRRGDRTLTLPPALVYLAEAEWRLGNEDASDEATREALAIATAQGNLRRLILALMDFPGVLSRIIDAEPGVDTEWHTLGRLLAGGLRPGVAEALTGGMLHLREFGEPALIAHGIATRPKLKKSLEMLSFLLSRRGARATRAEILSAIWDGGDDESTRAYLRQALRHLREVLPEGVSIEAVGSSLAVEGTVGCDSNEVAAMLGEAGRHQGERRRALLLGVCEILDRGTFLEGSEDVVWVDDRRAQLRAILIDARLDLADLALQAEAYLDALDFADKAITANPLLERGWRTQMRAYAMLGDLDAVLSTYIACRRALQTIGLEPSRETTNVFRSLRG